MPRGEGWASSVVHLSHSFVNATVANVSSVADVIIVIDIVIVMLLLLLYIKKCNS